MNDPATSPTPGWSVGTVAALSAQLAAQVTGVVRLQPRRLSAAARAALTLLSPATASGSNKASGHDLDVSLTPEPVITVRITTSTAAAPAAVAAQVRDEVAQAALRATGMTFSVMVIITDISPT